VAALCRGLRFDGDITLKDVAMAFQLRDAYDWDEDLEAAAKEVGAKVVISLCLLSVRLCCSCNDVMWLGWEAERQPLQPCRALDEQRG
jgi:hypothetical protein